MTSKLKMNDAGSAPATMASATDFRRNRHRDVDLPPAHRRDSRRWTLARASFRPSHTSSGTRSRSGPALSSGGNRSGHRDLAGMAEVIDQYEIMAHTAVATSAVRDAKNRVEFLDRVKQEAGFDVE